MLYRKICTDIEAHLRSGNDKIMVVEGARQIGKSFIIREVGSRLYPCFVEINFVKDDETDGLFRDIHGLDEFYMTLSMVAGGKLGNKSDTLIFLDEIQHYPQYLTMLKFLREDGKFNYIASGSMLGIALRNTTSIPVGSIIRKQMYQLDFEEWLMAEGWGKEALDYVRDCYKRRVSLTEAQHEKLLGEFRKYLLVEVCRMLSIPIWRPITSSGSERCRRLYATCIRRMQPSTKKSQARNSWCVVSTI